MKLKRLLASIVAGVCFVSCQHFSLTVNADKAIGDEYELNGLDPSTSPIKPTLSLSRIELPINIAKDNPTQEIELSVSGAENKYGAFGLHIEYDERLSIVMSNYQSKYYPNTLIYDYAVPIQKMKDLMSYTVAPDKNGLFITVSSEKNNGVDGPIFSFKLKLPEDLKVGDEFPVCIKYKNTPMAKDIFSNIDHDEQGQLMEAWTFTNGIEHGYIKITEDDPNYTPATTTTVTTTTKTSTTAATTTPRAATTRRATTIMQPKTKLPGDANVDRKVDMSDAVLIMQALINPDKYGLNGTDKSHITLIGIDMADVYEIGSGLTVNDALAIQLYLLKKIEYLPYTPKNDTKENEQEKLPGVNGIFDNNGEWQPYLPGENGWWEELDDGNKVWHWSSESMLKPSESGNTLVW